MAALPKPTEYEIRGTAVVLALFFLKNTIRFAVRVDDQPLKNFWPEIEALAADIADYLREGIAIDQGQIVDDMPRFTFLAKDRFSAYGIRAYQGALRGNDLNEQADEVEKALAEWHEWQTQNHSLVKDPDHIHVPSEERR
jgi:hypothetical protein